MSWVLQSLQLVLAWLAERTLADAWGETPVSHLSGAGLRPQEWGPVGISYRVGRFSSLHSFLQFRR